MLAHNIGNQDKGSGSALNGKAQQQLRAQQKLRT